MWYANENGSAEKPVAVDRDSSKIFVYVRKDFEEVEATDETPAHWKWQEQKIRKEDWTIYQTVIGHDEALDDVYAALTELADLIVEG